MLFPLDILERLIITLIKTMVNYLLACTVFNDFTDKGQICEGA